MAIRKRKTFAPSLELDLNDQRSGAEHPERRKYEHRPDVIRRWLTQYEDEQSGQPGIGKPLTAVAERSFLNLKMERVWQSQYANHAETKADITD